MQNKIEGRNLCKAGLNFHENLKFQEYEDHITLLSNSFTI